MKKELMLSLLYKLNGLHIPPTKLKKLLQKSYRILIKIKNLDESLIRDGIEIAISPYKTVDEICEALNIFQNSNSMQRDYVVNILLNKKAIRENIALEGAKIINTIDLEANAIAACEILTDVNAINYGVALEGAKIVSTVKGSFNGYKISNILINENILKSGISLLLANILKDTKQEFNSEYISIFLISVFLHNENRVDLNFILSFVQILKESPQEFNAKCILRYYEKGPIVDYDAALEMAKAINGIEDIIDLRSTYLLLGENLEVAFKLVKIIAGSKEDLLALKQVLTSEDEKERMYEYLKSLVLKNLSLYKTFNNLSKMILGRELKLEIYLENNQCISFNPHFNDLIEGIINKKENNKDQFVTDLIKVVENMPNEEINTRKIIPNLTLKKNSKEQK